VDAVVTAEDIARSFGVVVVQQCLLLRLTEVADVGGLLFDDREIQRYGNTRPGGSLCVLAVDSFARSLSPASYVEALGMGSVLRVMVVWTIKNQERTVACQWEKLVRLDRKEEA
jgi:hypothetical protein